MISKYGLLHLLWRTVHLLVSTEYILDTAFDFPLEKKKYQKKNMCLCDHDTECVLQQAEIL